MVSIRYYNNKSMKFLLIPAKFVDLISIFSALGTIIMFDLMSPSPNNMQAYYIRNFDFNGICELSVTL